MIWVIIIMGFASGIILGTVFKVQIPPVYAKYIGIALLASFDSLLGGLKAHFEKSFDEWIFITGFFFNAIAAGIFSYVGDRLGIDLYIAVLIVFGVRIFRNLGALRYYALKSILPRNK